MCRPSCCRHDSGPGAGIAAVAVLMLAALIVAKIGPVVAGIVHIALEVIRLAALATGVAVAVVVITWPAIKVTRRQFRRRTLAAARTRVATMLTIGFPADQVSGPANCLACGGTGTVLRAIGGSRYLPGDCPVCEPAQRAG